MLNKDALTSRFVKLPSEPRYIVDDVSVVFIDLVEFSMLRKCNDMVDRVEELQESLFGPLNPNYYWDEDDTQPGAEIKPNRIIVIPTGDGYAVAFHPAVGRLDVLRRVEEMYRDMVFRNRLEVRIGISRGRHVVFHDLNQTLNLIGEGIIRAQRAMTIANPKQILVTGEFAEDIENEVEGRLNPLKGLWQVKNEKPFRLYNYMATYGEKKQQIGNLKMPDKRYRTKIFR
jgi:hypothetical protein